MFYCSRDCQKSHWKAGHKKECKKKAATKIKVDEVQGILKNLTKTLEAEQEKGLRQAQRGMSPFEMRISMLAAQNFVQVGKVSDAVALDNPKTLKEACVAFQRTCKTLDFKFDKSTKTLEATICSIVAPNQEMNKWNSRYGSRDLLHWHVCATEAVNGTLHRLCYIAKRFFPGIFENVRVNVRCDGVDCTYDDDDEEDDAYDTHPPTHFCGSATSKMTYHPAKGPLQAYKFASEITVNLKKKKGEFVQSKVKDLYAGAHGFCGKPVPGKKGWFYDIDGDFYGYNNRKTETGARSGGTFGYKTQYYKGKLIRTGLVSIADLYRAGLRPRKNRLGV